MNENPGPVEAEVPNPPKLVGVFGASVLFSAGLVPNGLLEDAVGPNANVEPLWAVWPKGELVAVGWLKEKLVVTFNGSLPLPLPLVSIPLPRMGLSSMLTS